VRADHRRSGQSWCRTAGALALVLCSTGCRGAKLAPSIWPPADFELVVEQMRVVGARLDVVQRFRVRSDGLVVFGTSTTTLDAGEVRLPVFDRVAVYQMVPECTRALARRLERCGVASLTGSQGEGGADADAAVVLTWQAFGSRKRITARGRVHGSFAEILAVVGAHLPAGERFDLPGVAERGVAAVLHDVPIPRAGVRESLEVHRSLHDQRPLDQVLLLDAFALACHVGDRELAVDLLARWQALTADERREQQMFPDGEPRPQLTALESLLPRG
jgi:hypothetical protein